MLARRRGRRSTGAVLAFGGWPQSITPILYSHTYSEPTGGLQQYLARTIESHLRNTLKASNKLAIARYSPALNEKADLALTCHSSERRIFFEVEFRPNVEKDLIKFQIGQNRATLAAAALILAIDRNNINPGYYTMPEYGKFRRIIQEFKPSYPLLLFGIRVSKDAA